MPPVSKNQPLRGCLHLLSNPLFSGSKLRLAEESLGFEILTPLHLKKPEKLCIFQVQKKEGIMNVLFVDLANVCRSPLAEALLKKKYEDHQVVGLVDSAGFESFTINEPPDTRIVNLANEHGVLVDGRARIFLKDDFDKFDKIYVMDTQNYWDVMDLARNEKDKAKVDYLLNVLEPGHNKTVPDPYRSGIEDCKAIYKILDRATGKILEMALAEKERKQALAN